MRLTRLALLMTTLTLQPAPAAEDLPEALAAEGARVVLPVSAAKHPFSPEFIRSARAAFNNFHFQMGGDHALYYGLNLDNMLTTAEAAPNPEYRPLARAIIPGLGKIQVETASGKISLDDYAVSPRYRMQAMIMVHKGKVVYETYPGMNPQDRHFSASTGKTLVGLVMAQLVAEGKVDPALPVVHYVPELKGTAWDPVSTASVINMTTAFDNEETYDSIMEPDSAVVRFFAAMLGSPRATTGKQESWIEVARDQRPLANEAQGTHFRYASINTQVLTRLIENVEHKTFTDVFAERVWSKVTARRSAKLALTPQGDALPVGMLMVTPEDFVRFAMLFTPSWKAAASEPVVTDAVMKVIYQGVDPKRYAGTGKEQTSVKMFNDMAQGNAYQFDYIWQDGALAKSGNLNQMIYMDPKRDFAAIVFSSLPYHSGYGEFKAPAFMRAAAKQLAGQ
ncbi:serine hydrolase domain-containing protein [Aeromonas schubertii]|nr:serine hydrolase domain-containing protein [Aeromonas schubertii]